MVAIFADTTSSIPVSEAEKLKIEYLPQIIVFGDQTFRDDSEINTKTFLQKLKESNALPKTAAPPPALYNPLFEKYTSQKTPIIVLTPSAKVSGTFRSAEVAAQDFPEAEIHIIDTKNIGASFASIVKTAAHWSSEGKSATDILSGIQNLIEKERNIFVVDTLEYLYKGGRIGGAKMLVGSLLQVKPILGLREGQVEPIESQRTKKRALARLKELVLAECPHKDGAMLSIQHGDAESESIQLAEEFSSLMNLSKVEIYELPPAFLVHSGPGVIGVSYFVD